MIRRFVAVSLLLALVGSSVADGVPKDLSFIKSMFGPYASCNFGELSCSAKCEQVEICLGGETPEVVELCPTGTLCDEKTHTCNPDLKACNVVDMDKFICHGTVMGNFPNPFDCHSYFTCPEPTQTITVKPPGPQEAYLDDPRAAVEGKKFPCVPDTTAYDPLSGTCRFSSNHRVCKESPVPKCETLLQAGGLIENPNIYYVCVSVGGVLQPWLAKCAQATDVFQDGKCVTPEFLHKPRWLSTD